MGEFAEIMCLLLRERVDASVLYRFKTLVARPLREHSDRTALLGGEIIFFSVSSSVNCVVSKSMRVLARVPDCMCEVKAVVYNAKRPTSFIAAGLLCQRT